MADADGTARTPSYGIDSPMIVITFAAGAGAILVLAILTILGGGGLGAVGPLIGAALLGGAAFAMVRGSKVGKGRLWDQILDAHPLTGKERALDVGCGLGLVTVKLAQRLPSSTVTAIDLWRPRDQSGNSRAAAEANFAAAGVAERIDLHDGDVRDLPFRDDTFDLVTASLVLHHIPLPADRSAAMAEIIRVTRPGGRIIVADVGRTHEHGATLEAAGFEDLIRSGLRWSTYPPTRIVSGRKPTR